MGSFLCVLPPATPTPTWDQGPTLHWVGQGWRLQERRVSGRWSLQCLLWISRVLLSSSGWTQLTERTCMPVLPQGLLQFCHSSVTQLWGEQRTRVSGLSLSGGPSTAAGGGAAYMGGGQGFWLQSLMSPRGFMLDLLQ